MDAELLIWCAIGVMVATAWFFHRRRRPVRIDAHGVLIVRSLDKPLYLPWDDIVRFGVASASEIEGGLYQGFTQYVGVELTDSSRMKSTKACVDNRRLSDYDVLLIPDRGTSVDESAADLEKARTKFRPSSGQSPRNALDPA